MEARVMSCPLAAPALRLRADGLSCTRAGRTLFRELSLETTPGSALWVRGANGSGKTSLLRLLCGLAHPDSGSVSWQGENIRSERASLHASLLYIGHSPGLKGDLLAWENLVLAAQVGGDRVTRAQACEALDDAGLSEWAETPVRALSEGQRKRAGLARLQLSAGRPLWVLDEPFSALDDDACNALAATLERYVAGGGTLVLTTHQRPRLPNLNQLDLDRWAAC